MTRTNLLKNLDVLSILGKVRLSPLAVLITKTRVSYDLHREAPRND